ncbi:MAG: hypothetical protein OEW67_03500 [Cyclobacteriaceae bacterium]|nr:hypothetical protein [Cyclobacteriaceae bacterium]
MNDKNNRDFFSVKQFFDKINLIFHSILALPLLVFGWLFLEAKNGRFSAVETAGMNIINFILPFLILIIIGFSFLVFKKELKKINNELPLSKKLESYLKCALMKFAGLEFALVLSVLGYYLTFTNTFVAMFMIILVFFSLSKPTPYRIVNNLQLKGEERDMVINKAEKDQSHKK